MQSPQSEKRRPKRLIVLLLAVVIFMGAFLIATALLRPQNDFDNPIVDPTKITSEGSIGENVVSIQIDQLLVAPEFNVGGTLAGVVACFLSLAFLMVRRKQSNSC